MFEWHFASNRSRGAQWYVFGLIIVLFLVIYGIFEGMYIMSIVAFLFAGVYILIENNATPVTSVRIDEATITVNTTIYEISKISKYGILSHEGKPYALRIFIPKHLPPVVDIPFTTEVDGHAVQEYLSTRIAFDPDIEISQGDRIIGMLGL